MPPSLLEQLASTPLSGANASYVEALYEQYLRDPASVDAAWRSYFDALPSSDGPVGSGLVAMNRAPRSMRRIALVIASKL